jgi:hypothetical protein
MKTTKARRQLINDAKAAGYRVNESPASCSISTGKTNRSVGLVIWEDGKATRLDIDHAYCLAIRTVKEMRSTLGLERKTQ